MYHVQSSIIRLTDQNFPGTIRYIGFKFSEVTNIETFVQYKDLRVIDILKCNLAKALNDLFFLRGLTINQEQTQSELSWKHQNAPKRADLSCLPANGELLL